MKFITLMQDSGNPVYVNINCIAGIRHSQRTGYTHIALTNGGSYCVLETPEEVLKMIKEAENT